MKSEVARLFVYQIEFNVSFFWSAVFLILNFDVLHYSDLRLQRILVSKQNSLLVAGLSKQALRTISILEKSQPLRFFEAPFQEIEPAKAARPHGYYCAVCPRRQYNTKERHYAFYDPCPRPMAWARVTRPCVQGGGFCCCVKLDSSYHGAKNAEIF